VPRFRLGGRDAPHPVFPVNILPPGRQCLVEARSGREQEQGNLTDSAIFVGVENLQQPPQFILIQVPFYFVVLVVLLHARGRIPIQQSPVHGQIEGMPQQLQVVIARGRRQTLLADGGVECLNLVARDLIEFLVTEGFLQPQAKKFFVLVGGALPWSDIRKIIVFHEGGEGGDGPIVLPVLSRVTGSRQAGGHLGANTGGDQSGMVTLDTVLPMVTLRDCSLL
jgi:hypothetical protein